MHRPLAARACSVLWFDHHLDARQMRGQRLALRPSRRRAPDRLCGVLCELGLGLCHRLLDLFQGELQLIGIKPLRAASETGALQLTKQVMQPLDLFNDMIALSDSSVTLGNQEIAFSQLTAGQLAQRFDVVREEFGVAHARQ
jgi:hypothetical protein